MTARDGRSRSAIEADLRGPATSSAHADASLTPAFQSPLSGFTRHVSVRTTGGSRSATLPCAGRALSGPDTGRCHISRFLAPGLRNAWPRRGQPATRQRWQNDSERCQSRARKPLMRLPANRCRGRMAGSAKRTGKTGRPIAHDRPVHVSGANGSPAAWLAARPRGSRDSIRHYRHSE